jgi:hypothetical protein
MARLRASLDSGVVISDDEERRLMLWEENGGTDLIDPLYGGNEVRDSMALMLY